ncbi:hypothetical protein Tco_0006894 [Tanacetum coccineum]
MTFAKRLGKHIPNLLPKVITRIKSWKGRFFFVQDSIVPVDYLELLSKDNRWDKKYFKDKLPDMIHENPSFQRLGRYPIDVRTFPDPILFLAGLKTSWEHGQQRPAIFVSGKEMAFRNFMFAKDDEDLSFLPKESSLGFGGSPMRQEKLVIHPGSVAARIKDRKCRTRGSLKPPIKRRLVQGASSSRATRQKTASSKDDSPFLTISGDDEDVLELQNANACHLKISNITPPAWRGPLHNQLDGSGVVEAKCEAAMADFDNNAAVNVLREKIPALSGEVKEHKASLERMLLENKKWAGYQVSLSALESKVASLEAEKARLEASELSLHQEVENVKRDKVEVVSKVVPYAAMELVHSDELGRLVGKLASASVFYDRCAAFEEFSKMKEPFDLSKVKGYRSSYKKEHNKARNDLMTATFPFLSEVVVDPSAPIDDLLSKKAAISSTAHSNKNSCSYTIEGHSCYCSGLPASVSSSNCLKVTMSVIIWFQG